MANYKKIELTNNGYGLRLFFPEDEFNELKGSLLISSTYPKDVTMGLLYCITQGFFEKGDNNALLSSVESLSDRKD